NTYFYKQIRKDIMGLLLPPTPLITLLGAGPGDPELLTIKGLKALQSANFILYDALVNPALLDLAAPGIPRKYVGKRCGAHSYTQEAINKILVDSAKEYGHVVRLKGGDPFVFGRGGEEALAAGAAGIRVNVIPGISSALAVPALMGIPLTHRGVSRGFTVVTGTTKHQLLPKEISDAARTTTTCVILMGTRHIEAICELFREHRAADTPIALVQSGSLPEAKVTVGTITKPTPLLAAAENKVPGILVIGEVVRLREVFPHWITQMQLG
ncbi:MAG: uroporphyrinogen-III C-methyltransferase, partial [Bacteroidota bacterium]